MIAIVNVDKDPRESGPHLYELRINSRVILTFTHNREGGLARCLQEAATAARKRENEAVDRLVEAYCNVNSR